jgi:hypothetical protein
MGGEGDFQDVEIDNQSAGFNHEELFGCLDTMKCDSSFVAVADARVSIVVGQVFYNKFLADVDYLMNIFAC